MQAGSIYLASRSGLPLVPAGFAFEGCWRAGSWDKMALPSPFRRAVCIAGVPMNVPAGLGRDGIEEYRLKVQAEMDRVQTLAEKLSAEPKIDRRLTPRHRL